MKTIQIVGDSKYGGATYLILEWCKYLLARHCQVDVLSTDAKTREALQKIPGVGIIDDIYIPREITPVQDLRALWQTINFLRRRKYDVVHTYTATPGFLGRLAARLAGVPVIVHHQAGWTVTEFSSRRERFIYTPLEYLATCFSTKAICVGHAVYQAGRSLKIAPPSKLVTICNGIEPRRFMEAARQGNGRALRQELGLPPATLLIGSTGRLSRQKDFGTLIQGAAMLRELEPTKPFAVVVAGDGPDRQALEALARELHLAEQCHLPGFRQDIPMFLASLDIFVSSSLWEGLSISLLEAMATARPIVATSILPNAELIEPEVTGLLVPPQDPASLARAMARFIHEPTLAAHCAQQAQQRVLKNYSIDRMFQETWDLYVKALQETCGSCHA